MKLKFALLFFKYLLVIGINHSYGQCTCNIISNGSFISAEGENVTASSWIPTSTPDINDAIGSINTSTGYTWTGTPISSSDSGTWQNLFGPETVKQTVNLIGNQTYRLNFEYAAQGITDGFSTFIDPVGVNIYINGILFYTTTDDRTQYTWESESISYTATFSGPHIIKFEPSQQQYLAIDGVCLSPTPTVGLGANSTLCKGETVLEIPNVFTPNNDGINDLFVPIVSKGIVSMTTIIYNRWGNKIYETNNLLIEWNGQDVSDGTYFWIVYYTDINRAKNYLKGYLTIFK